MEIKDAIEFMKEKHKGQVCILALLFNKE